MINCDKLAVDRRRYCQLSWPVYGQVYHARFFVEQDRSRGTQVRIFIVFIAFRVDKKLIVWSSEYVAYIYHVTSLICNGQTRRSRNSAVWCSSCCKQVRFSRHLNVCSDTLLSRSVIGSLFHTIKKFSFWYEAKLNFFSINRSIILILNWSVSIDYWRCRSPNVTWPVTRPFINILCCFVVPWKFEWLL